MVSRAAICSQRIAANFTSLPQHWFSQYGYEWRDPEGKFAIASAVGKLEKIGHVVVAALSKARELNGLGLDSGSRKKVEELMKAAKDSSQKIEALAELTGKNGKLDKATVDAALDRILAAMKGINEELDELLAKARN